ncbi:hypothetical protein HK097_001217, partial [Rhizophlyctis rosea]
MSSPYPASPYAQSPHPRGLSTERLARAASVDPVGMLEQPFAADVVRSFHPGTLPTSHFRPQPSPLLTTSPLTSSLFRNPFLPAAPPPLDNYVIQKWSPLFFREDTIRSICTTFFSHFYWYLLGSPNHPPTFFQTFQHNLAYRPFFIYSLCALAAPWSDGDCQAVRYFCDEENLPLWQAGDVYYNAARSMVHAVVEEECLEHVIALGNLAVYARERGELSTSFQWIGMAMRMATSLEYNVDPDVVAVHGHLTWIQKEARRRIWLGMCLEEFVGTMMVDRPVSKGYENLMTLEDSTPATSLPHSTSFNDGSLPDITSQLHSTRPSTAVKAYTNETVWLSVKTLDGEPSVEALILGNDLDPTKTLVYLVGLYSKCLGLCGTVTKFLKRRSSGADSSSPPPYGSSLDPSQAYPQYASSSQPQQQQSRKPPNLVGSDIPLSPDHLSTKRIALQRELEAFRTSLPEWARNVDKFPGDDPTRAQRYPIYHVM